MACYELHTIPRHGRQRTGSIAFAATGLGQALSLVDQLTDGDPVELWQGEHRVCRLQRSSRSACESAFWMVS